METESNDSFETAVHNDVEMNVASTSTPEKPKSDDNVAGSPKSKSENVEPEEECSVCRNEMIETTTLSDCIHEFCFDCITGWLIKGSGLFCPMCKTPVKYIQRKGTDQRVMVEELLAQKEPVVRESRDLVTEKRIVSRKMRNCRRMMNKIDELISALSRSSKTSKKQSRLEELNRCKQLCVSQLNSLQVLRDDINNGAAKALVVSKVSFRRLVYERQVVSDDSRHVESLPSKEEFLENIEHYRASLHSFLTIELKAIPVKNQPRIDQESSWFFYTLNDFMNGEEEVLINRIFEMITEKGADKLRTKDFDDVFNGRISARPLLCFIGELKSLIGSRKTFLEWCGSVRYRFRMDGGDESSGNVPEIVVVDDSVEVEEPPPSSSRNSEREIYNNFDKIFGVRDPIFPNAFVNHRASSSDSDHDDDIYFQAPLRLDGPSSSSRPPPPPASNTAPKNGFSWSDLTTPSSLLLPQSSNNAKRVTISDELSRIGESHTTDENEDDDDDDIQVLDENETICLDQTVENAPGPSNAYLTVPESRDRSKKRKSDEPTAEIRKRKRTEFLPEGLVGDVQQLMEKYDMSSRSALNMMVDAVQTVLDKKTAEENAQLSIEFGNRDSSGYPRRTETSSPSFYDYVSQRGLGAWSNLRNTQTTSGEVSSYFRDVSSVHPTM